MYGSVLGTASSNIATTVLQGALSADKSSLSDTYRPGEDITFILSMTNNNQTSALTNVTVTDDLGTYTLGAGASQITPLTYTGAAKLYVNGVLTSMPEAVVADHSVTFTIPSLPAGAGALILYEATVNDYAPAEAASSVTNTAEFAAEGVSETVYASNTVTSIDFADVRIIKSMTPNPVTDGSVMTYTFSIYNYGNVPATSVVLTDAFEPAPGAISVTVDGAAVSADEYSYTDGVFTLPGTDAQSTEITVPAAQFIQAENGEYSAVPGVTVIVVNGTI